MSIDWMRQNDAAEMAKTAGIEADDFMFSGSGVEPWHMPWYGTQVTVLKGNPTAEEALDAAKLRWRVEKEPIFTVSGDEAVAIPRYYAIVRDSDRKALGVVQQRYQVLQNEDAFAWANNLMGGGIGFETAGSLKGGRIVYITAKTPFKVDLPGGDKLETYLLISNRHDGSGAVTVAIITIRVVCSNTLSRSIAGSMANVKIRHTLSLPARMQQAQKILGLAQGATDRAEQVATELLKVKLPEVKFQSFLDLLMKPEVDAQEEPTRRELLSLERRREAIEDVYLNHPTQQDIKGTAWGAYNAVTFYNDHLTPRRQSEDSSPADSRMLAIVGGSNLGDKALEILSDEFAIPIVGK